MNSKELKEMIAKLVQTETDVKIVLSILSARLETLQAETITPKSGEYQYASLYPMRALIKAQIAVDKAIESID